MSINFKYLKRKINFDYDITKDLYDLKKSNLANSFIDGRISRYSSDYKKYKLTLFSNSNFILFLFIQIICLLYLKNNFEFLFILIIRVSSSSESSSSQLYKNINFKKVKMREERKKRICS